MQPEEIKKYIVYMIGSGFTVLDTGSGIKVKIILSPGGTPIFETTTAGCVFQSANIHQLQEQIPDEHAKQN